MYNEGFVNCDIYWQGDYELEKMWKESDAALTETSRREWRRLHWFDSRTLHIRCTCTVCGLRLASLLLSPGDVSAFMSFKTYRSAAEPWSPSVAPWLSLQRKQPGSIVISMHLKQLIWKWKLNNIFTLFSTAASTPVRNCAAPVQTDGYYVLAFIYQVGLSQRCCCFSGFFTLKISLLERRHGNAIIAFSLSFLFIIHGSLGI
jgi:hypothetical protein